MPKMHWSLNFLKTFLHHYHGLYYPENLLDELYRIVKGKFIAISTFYPEDDQRNGAVIEEAGLVETHYRDKLLEHYHNAGWEVEVKNSSSIKTKASPTGIVLEGAKVDLLPAALVWVGAFSVQQKHNHSMNYAPCNRT